MFRNPTVKEINNCKMTIRQENAQYELCKSIKNIVVSFQWLKSEENIWGYKETFLNDSLDA